MALTATDLRHAYGSVEVIRDLSFSVAAGKVVCLVGPSGAGKSTTLRCLAGLLAPTSGTVRIGDQRVVGPPESLAVVFQDYGRSLMPWMRVAENVELPLRARRIPRSLRRKRAAAALSAVGLEGSGHLYPWQMSGGMQQRVAIARAIAYEPAVLLMDEPFASVDAQTRADLEDLVLELRARLGFTIVIVTHDIDEAVYLADEVVVLSARPATVLARIEVGLTSPRDQVTTKADPGFTDLRSEVLRLIRRS
jgi:NitT/TauT family transport system ATP-binding protein